MTTPTHCSYVYDSPRYECRLPAQTGSDKCILHTPAGGKDQAQFLTALRRKVQSDQQDLGIDAIHLEGIIAPGEFTWREVVEGLEIKKSIRFISATFSANADFSEATFSADAYFWRTTFSAGAYFWRATFSANTYFWEATFAATAYFSQANFAANVDFFGATFATNANFGQATFSADAGFWEATFAANADFSQATFMQRLTFRSLNPPREETVEGKSASEDEAPPARVFPLDFSSVILEQPRLVSFEDIDLSGASFLSTNLSHVRFIAVAWASKRERLWRMHLPGSTHFQIGDHVKLEEQWKGLNAEQRQQRAALVADEYRQLRLNLESDHQEIEAGHFYIGQMDMRRKVLSRRDPYDWGLWLYRQIAMYGQSAWRPLLFYLFLSAALGLTYLFTGTVTEVADHHWAWGGRPFVLLGDFWKAFFLAASAGALLRDSVHGVGGCGAALVYLNMVADIFLIALFVIALRRHFHR